MNKRTDLKKVIKAVWTKENSKDIKNLILVSERVFRLVG